MLGQQRRAAAFALRFFEGGAGLLNPLNLGLHPLVADLHRHGVDGGGFVERKQISRVDRSIERIGEGLGHGHGRQIALHVGVDVGLEQREGDGLAVHLGFDAPAQIVGNDGQRAAQGQTGQQADEQQSNFLHDAVLKKLGFRGRG